MTAPVIVKIGTSSLAGGDGVDKLAIEQLAGQVKATRDSGRPVVVVSSGAVTAGLPRLGAGDDRSVRMLQAASAVGQIELMQVWRDALAAQGLVAAQVLLTQAVFRQRSHYLQARSTLELLLQLGVVPVVNENDAVADDELPFGDNDRLAALVAHLVVADVLVLLTDTSGVFTADPRFDASASLIEEIVEVDHEMEQVAGQAGERGRGGMASKLASAKIAAWTGVRTVIAAASRPDVVIDAVEGRPGVGTVVLPHDRRLPARKLWIAFASVSMGRISVDAGARSALVDGNRSLLPAGIIEVHGDFETDAAVEVEDDEGTIFAKGLVRLSAADIRAVRGLRTDQLPDGLAHETIHRDDLVVLPR